MASQLDAVRDQLLSLLEQHEATRGLYVNVRGKQLILGRREEFGPDYPAEDNDRIRLTHLGGDSFGLSVLRHTGRWEKTPFSGTVEQLVDVMIGPMQHLLADWP